MFPDFRYQGLGKLTKNMTSEPANVFCNQFRIPIFGYLITKAFNRDAIFVTVSLKYTEK